MATQESLTWPAQHWPVVEFEVTIPRQLCQKEIPEWTIDENIAKPLEGSSAESVASASSRDNACLWGMGSHNEESPLCRGLPAGLRHGDACWTLGTGSATPEWFLETAVSRAGHYQQSWPPMRVGGLWIVGRGRWKGTHCRFCTCSLIRPSLPLAQRAFQRGQRGG